MMERYRKSKKELYLIFVDFRKAYDQVWHSGLLYKLATIGVSSNFYSLIKDMYSKSQLSVQHGDTISPSFRSEIGVRQGDNLSPTLSFNIFVNDLPALFTSECSPAKFGDLTVPCLLYADDLVIMSECKEGAQKAMKKLEDWCDIWALNVNTSKSKLMGTISPPNSSNPILFRNEGIEEVTSYKYLGIELHFDGSISHAKADLAKRASKVMFKITRSLKHDPQVNTMLHLFDHMVKPVLLYGGEILGYHNLNSRKSQPNAQNARASFFQQLKLSCPIISNYLDKDDPLEKLHLKFCKYTLGVHKKTSNMATLSELGRYPIAIDKIIQSMKYYYHLEFSTENKLLHTFYGALKGMEERKRPTSIVDFATRIHNLTNIPLPSHQNMINRTVRMLRYSLQTNFEHYCNQIIKSDFSKNSKTSGNKLRTYRLFKNCFGRESYLDLTNTVLRCSLSKFRLSAHKLKIETGRYNSKNAYTKPEDRLCTICDLGECENEKHFLLTCPAYKDERKEVFKFISISNKWFTGYSDDEKLVWILSNEDPQIMQKVAKFIYENMKVRDHKNKQP
jgi:sorting nexin-29